MTKLKVRVNGEEIELEVARQGDTLQVTHGGKTTELRLRHADGPAFVLEYQLPDGTRHSLRAAGVIRGDQRHLWVNGRTITYERLRAGVAATPTDHHASLTASIPAVVSQILVNAGDVVAAGDRLILLESMKMVIPIQAPYAGAVSRINCAEGEAVQAGVPLIELEEEK